jgi:hypothetical protein
VPQPTAPPHSTLGIFRLHKIIAIERNKEPICLITEVNIFILAMDHILRSEILYTRKSYGGVRERSDVRADCKFQGFASLKYGQQWQDGTVQNPAEV